MPQYGFCVQIWLRPMPGSSPADVPVIDAVVASDLSTPLFSGPICCAPFLTWESILYWSTPFRRFRWFNDTSFVHDGGVWPSRNILVTPNTISLTISWDCATAVSHWCPFLSLFYTIMVFSYVGFQFSPSQSKPLHLNFIIYV